ncbi:MAG TPA: hypothetical protein PLK40_07755 [Bacteroidaceae bacterium]|nr:hypothetical protein [Bacteroidaceae bacterium]
MHRIFLFYLFVLLPVLFSGCSSDNDSPLNYDDLSGTIWEGVLKEVGSAGETLNTYQAFVEFTSKDSGYTYTIDKNGLASDNVSFNSSFIGDKRLFLTAYGAGYCPLLNRSYNLIKSSSNYMAWESFGINSWVLTLRKKH